MAIQITNNFTSMGGVDFSQLYIRFNAYIDFDGKKVTVHSQSYASKAAYLEKDTTNILRIKEIPEIFQFNYDRIGDGTDILDYIHTKAKTWLGRDKTEDQPLLDPSTGELQYDPSTGELITQAVVTIPKFADPADITIVDLS